MNRVPSAPPSSRSPVALSRQRRGSRRVELNANIEVLHPRAGSGVTINVSEGGLRVAVDCALREGEVCLVRVSEPSLPERLEQFRVAWSRELIDGWIAGLQVIGLH